jgi:hypothetical protein
VPISRLALDRDELRAMGVKDWLDPRDLDSGAGVGLRYLYPMPAQPGASVVDSPLWTDSTAVAQVNH